MTKSYLLILPIVSLLLSCDGFIEDLALFRNESSYAHVDEYHMDDSLSMYPEDRWEMFESIGEIKTDGLLVRCDTSIKPYAGKVVLFFGGQDMCLLSNVGVAKQFVQCGVDCFTIDFRGYGRSYDSFDPSEKSFYEDAAAARSFLIDSLGYTDDDIIVSGYSLGTGVAIDIAAHKTPFMVVLFAAYTSMDDMVETETGGYNIPGSWYLKARFNSIGKIADLTSPICFFSGKDDCLIPSDQTKELYKKAPDPKVAHYLSGQDHSRFVPDAFSQWKPLFESFLDDQL